MERLLKHKSLQAETEYIKSRKIKALGFKAKELGMNTARIQRGKQKSKATNWADGNTDLPEYNKRAEGLTVTTEFHDQGWC